MHCSQSWYFKLFDDKNGYCKNFTKFFWRSLICCLPLLNSHFFKISIFLNRSLKIIKKIRIFILIDIIVTSLCFILKNYWLLKRFFFIDNSFSNLFNITCGLYKGKSSKTPQPKALVEGVLCKLGWPRFWLAGALRAEPEAVPRHLALLTIIYLKHISFQHSLMNLKLKL